jgi:hypothetical protein
MVERIEVPSSCHNFRTVDLILSSSPANVIVLYTMYISMSLLFQ